MTAWSDEEQKMQKGQAVQVTGIVKEEGYTFIQVENGSEIIATSGVRMEPDQMINITATP